MIEHNIFKVYCVNLYLGNSKARIIDPSLSSNTLIYVVKAFMKSGNVVCSKTTFQSEIPLHLNFSSWPEFKILHELLVRMSLFCNLIKLVLLEMCVEIKSILSQRALLNIK